MAFGQESPFDSFISRLSSRYQVDVAVAPELIPALDSIKKVGPGFTDIEDFLRQILSDKGVSYQIVDGNKILLRSEKTMVTNKGMIKLRGMVIDSSNQAPLPYVAVNIMNTQHGSYTDDCGLFTLYADDTLSSLQISYLGFKPITLPVSEFMGKQKSVEMVVDQIALKQVVIIVPFQQLSTGEERHSIDLKGYQFFSTDELLSWRTDKLMDHLTGYTRFSSEQGIRIRGIEEGNSLIMMDGLPVYDPYHFYNIFSPFNGHYFSSVNLYKNNMPVQYGGRIDGMIELNSTHLTTRPKLILDTDLLLTSLSGYLPVTNKIRFTAGGRISHTGLLSRSLRDSSTSNFTLPGKFRDENEWTSSQQPAFNFYDVNLGLNADVGKQNNLTLTYFKSKDYLDNLVRNELTATLQNNETISFKQSITNRDDWQNEGFAIGLQSRWTENIVFNINGYLSSFEKNITYTSSLEEQLPNATRTSINTGFQNSTLQTAGLKAFIEQHKPGVSGYTFGLDFQNHEVSLIAKENITPYLLEVQDENEATLFGEYARTFYKHLDIAIGGRMTFLKSTSELYPQPNLRINYFLGDDWSIKSSFSKNIQSLRELTVENRFGREVEFLALSQPDASYPVLSSNKYMLGAGYKARNVTIDGELYYKKTEGLINVRAPRPDPSFRDETSPVDFYRFYTGEGWTSGIDLLASCKIKKSETSVSYTLSKISQQFNKLFKGISFSPTEDRRHQIKLSSRYKMAPFMFSGLLSYKTKAPYISLIRLEGQGEIGMVNQGMVLRYLPPYFSLDLGLDYSFRIATHPAQLGLSLINATNHENINDVQHIGRIARNADMGGLYLTHETELLGRTLNLHFRMLID